MRKMLAVIAAVVVGLGGIALGLRMNGISLEEAKSMVLAISQERSSRRTTEGVMADVEKARPQLAEAAMLAGKSLRIYVFKQERLVELSSPGWKAPRVYPMTAFSGELGPKLREGDRQIPEGIYRVE